MQKSAATLTIRNASKMTDRQRKGIVHWLDKMIDRFSRDYEKYPALFRDTFWTDSETRAATLTMRGVSQMTDKGRKNIARWLERQIGFFLNHPKELSPRFTARYIVGAGPKGDVIITDEPPRKHKAA